MQSTLYSFKYQRAYELGGQRRTELAIKSPSVWAKSSTSLLHRDGCIGVSDGDSGEGCDNIL